MISSDFYITLPSNASMDFYPTNSPAHFYTRLASPISLNGQWEVGLSEIHLPLLWRNIDIVNNMLEVSRPKRIPASTVPLPVYDPPVTITVDAGSYPTIADVINRLQKQIAANFGTEFKIEYIQTQPKQQRQLVLSLKDQRNRLTLVGDKSKKFWRDIVGVDEQHIGNMITGVAQSRLTLRSKPKQAFSLKEPIQLILTSGPGKPADTLTVLKKTFRSFQSFINELNNTIKSRGFRISYSDKTNELTIEIPVEHSLQVDSRLHTFWSEAVGIPDSLIGVPIAGGKTVAKLTPLPTEPVDLKVPLELKLEKFKTLQNVPGKPTVDSYGNKKLYLEPGHYPTIKDVVEMLNEKIREVQYQDGIRFSSDKNSGRVGFTLTPHPDPNITYRLKFPPGADSLASMLGFSQAQQDVWYENVNEVRGDYEADIHRGVYGIYVYSNLILPQFTGDTTAPLIRVISPSESTNTNRDVVSYHYQQIYYYPLARNYFDTVEIVLRSDSGRELQFIGGKTLMVLHFRRKNSI